MHQIVMALTEGTSLPEHDNPGEATIYLIKGVIQLATGNEATVAEAGDFLVIPDGRHSLKAIEDSAFILTSIRERSIIHH